MHIRSVVPNPNDVAAPADYGGVRMRPDSEGWCDRALQVPRRWLGIRTAAVGEGHPDVAPCDNNIAGVHKAKGEYDRARELYHRSLGIRKAALGDAHPLVATGYSNIASVCNAKGEYDTALEIYEWCLGIRRC